MYIIIGYLLCLGLLKLLIPSAKLNNKIFIIFAGTLLLIISALRRFDFSKDVIWYVNNYNLLIYQNLSELWLNFINNSGKDPFFYLFSKIISLLGFNSQIWLAIIALIFCYSIFKLIYNYSSDPYISIVALISLGYLLFSLTGLRQTLALSMIILSYPYLRNRNLGKFLLMVFLGYLFHATSIIFLLAYPLAYMKIGMKQNFGILIAIITASFFKEEVLKLLLYINDNERYLYYIESEFGLTISGFIIQLIIYIFCLYYKDSLIKKDKKNITLYNLLFLGIVFQAYSLIIAEFFRISIYFNIFSIILISLSINVEKNKYRKSLIYLMVFSALFAYILWAQTFNGFSFFWEE